MRKFAETDIKANHCFALRGILYLLSCCFLFNDLKAQSCPYNIDFETGTFDGWVCYTGNVAAVGDQNVITLNANGGPSPGQHQMFSASVDRNTLDYYGDFPVLCPNGSSHSVKLGNTSGGAEAEGLSYTFTIPPDRNTYSLVYQYAVVFQDPKHLPYQQPRLELEVMNMTDNELITCSSFTFFPNGSPLPGFFQSPKSDSTPVWCKDWSAVTINLNGKAGKEIRLFFKTADCTFRRHFGYAYIDVNTECSSEFVGATYCPDDTAVNIRAPYGYQFYTWYNNDFTRMLGEFQTLHLAPPPAVGTTIALELVPFDGYGCKDTLYARLIDTLTMRADAGPDVVSCNGSPVMLGTYPLPGAIYSWSPGNNLSSADISNPWANPTVTTPYTLTIRSSGGGCLNSDMVTVTASVIDSSLQIAGKQEFCITTGDSAVLSVQPTGSIQWWKDNSKITGATSPRYKVTQTGNYSAVLANNQGCSVQTRIVPVLVETPRPGIGYPLEYAVINDPIQLSARAFGSSVLWQPPTYLNNAALVNPLFNAPSLLEQLYTIKITTATGCVTIDSQVVKTIKEIKIYVPTAFTPNNDGLNDFLKPILLGIKTLHYFRVYNRWGQLVYDMRSDQRGWDGAVNGMIQQTGVFVWMIEGIGLDKRIYRQKGTCVLIRK